MRNLYNYITTSSKDATLVADYNLKEVPSTLKVYDDVQELADNQALTAVLKGLREWYKDNKTRRNVHAGTSITAVFYVADPNNKVLMSVIEELKKIGVYGENGEFDTIDRWRLGGSKLGTCTVDVSVSTYKQLGADNYKTVVSNNTFSPTFRKTNYGNGYNHLPAEDMNILRQKLYDCMNGTLYEIKEFPGDKKSLDIPSYVASFTAQYDKKKLKEFLDYLKNDRRLQNFANQMDATSKGIQAYYASKRPGDYVGD